MTTEPITEAEATAQGVAMYIAHNPYRNGIDSVELCFAHKTLREVREALEHGAGFIGPISRDVIDQVTDEVIAIAVLLKEKENV